MIMLRVNLKFNYYFLHLTKNIFNTLKNLLIKKLIILNIQKFKN